jgi:hypothetical protein
VYLFVLPVLAPLLWRNVSPGWFLLYHVVYGAFLGALLSAHDVHSVAVAPGSTRAQHS